MNKICFFLVLTSALTIFTQERENKEGDYYYGHFQYYEAALSYKEAYELDETDFDIAYKLAESYRLYFNYSNAEHYYQLVSANALIDYPMSQFWFAEMLKLRGEYHLAKIEFEKLIENEKLLKNLDKEFDIKTQLELDGCYMALNELKKPQRDFSFQKVSRDLNSESVDYAPVIYKNDSSLIFSSTRIEGDDDFKATRNVSNHLHFEKEAIGWVEAFDEDNFYEMVNSKYNEGAGSFTSNRHKYYFTRCNGKQKHAKYKEFNCLIYVTKKEKGNWVKAVPLNENINPKGQWTANPSVSKDGDTLYFVSKRPGGKGMHDIWYSTSDGGDAWKEAVNLKAVNTAFIDMCPNYDVNSGFLFFSSNGRESFGGLDIFRAHGVGFKEVENMGLPFNSNSDDFYLSLGDSLGYLTSNRKDSYEGSDDIYTFTKNAKKGARVLEIPVDSLIGSESVSITGLVLDAATHQPVENVVEILVDGNGKHLKTTRSNQKGEFKFDNLPVSDSINYEGLHYEVVIEDQGNYSLVNSSSIIIEDIQVVKSNVAPTVKNFENIYFDFNKSALRPEAQKVLASLVNYIVENPKVQVEINANTDDVGASAYNFKLSEKRGNAAYRFLIAHDIDQTSLVINALGEDVAFVENTNEIGRQLNRRVEFKLVGGGAYSPEAVTHVVEANTSLKAIAEKFNMTIDQLKELNDLEADHVKAFQPLRVRSIGDDDLVEPFTLANAKKHNKRYYKKRSKRFYAYKSDYNTMNATYHNYEKVKEDLALDKKQDYYVALKKNTLWRIAKLYDMSLQEIMSLNDLTSELIFINQPIIVVLSNRLLSTSFYRVKNTDTLASIGRKFGLKVKTLIELNEMKGYSLRKGMVLKVEP